jgi:hypothetical protein
MSAFEYTSVMASIIVGLALVDILVSLNRLIRAGGSVRWHWAAPVTAGLITLTVIQIWWSIYSPQDTPMTIGQFLPLLVELVLLFLLAAAALPDDIPAGGIDLRIYYDRNGPYLWSLFAAALGWALAVSAMEWVMAGETPLGFLDQHLVDLLVLALFVSLIFVRRLWWHMIVLAFAALGPIGWLSRSLG